VTAEAIVWGVVGLLATYLFSAVPFGLLMFKLGRGGDIRKQGSGNIGATNVFRAGGKAVGIATLLLDIGKGALSVLLVRSLTQGDVRWQAAAAFVAVLGHCFPIYLGFKGGKGIATGCGAYGVLAPVPMGIALCVFLVALLLTRMVSVGSICAGIAVPLLIVWLQPERALLISVAAAAALVLMRHQANIRRIATGGEHRIHGS
jgi:acyl phosphate:glycerol-3-phosphate acyltransferase